MRPNSAPDLLSFTVRSIPRSSHLASKLNLRLQNRCSQTSGWHHGSIISSVSELNQQLKHITRTYHEMLRFCSLFSKLFFFFCPSKHKVEPRSYLQWQSPCTPFLTAHDIRRVQVDGFLQCIIVKIFTKFEKNATNVPRFVQTKWSYSVRQAF